MLSRAILSIQDATMRADRGRACRAAGRADLTTAEQYAVELEELLLRGRSEVPPALMRDIRDFVLHHERGLARRLTDAPASLDALFDLQERLQARRSGALDVELRRTA